MGQRGSWGFGLSVYFYRRESKRRKLLAAATKWDYNRRYGAQFSVVRGVSQVSHEMLASVARRDRRRQCVRGMGEGAKRKLPRRRSAAIGGHRSEERRV